MSIHYVSQNLEHRSVQNSHLQGIAGHKSRAKTPRFIVAPRHPLTLFNLVN